MPETAEVIDYKWTSDNETVAVVSGEMNCAVVEAKAAGKAKITDYCKLQKQSQCRGKCKHRLLLKLKLM